MLIGMANMIIEVDARHIAELLERFPRVRAFPPPGEVQSLVEITIDDQQSDSGLSQFVRRCIGTTLRFEDHQRAGGIVYLGYPDGSLRELVVDTQAEESVELPRPATRPSPGIMRSVGRRASRRWGRDDHV